MHTFCVVFILFLLTVCACDIVNCCCSAASWTIFQCTLNVHNLCMLAWNWTCTCKQNGDWKKEDPATLRRVFVGRTLLVTMQWVPGRLTITVVSWVSAHGRSTINPHFHMLGAYSVQQLKEAGSIIMGVALAKYAHARTCTLYIEHVCMIFRPSTRATRKE